MKITGPQVGQIDPAYLGKIKKAAPATSKDIKPADSVVLSEDVSTIEAARQIINATPDIRQEKIDALRREVENGTYQVPAEKIAEKILAEKRFSKLGQK